jgi:hypothetical protein
VRQPVAEADRFELGRGAGPGVRLAGKFERGGDVSPARSSSAAGGTPAGRCRCARGERGRAHPRRALSKSAPAREPCRCSPARAPTAPPSASFCPSPTGRAARASGRWDLESMPRRISTAASPSPRVSRGRARR